MSFQVGRRRIGPGEPCFIIAEVGLAHDGSMGAAHAYIDACAAAKVDAVKFQCHTGDPTTEWRVKPDWCQDANRQDYWRRTAFSEAQWQELARHCAVADVEFLCSVFSVEALRLIEPLVVLHKVPSGRVTDNALMSAIEDTAKPVLLSTGMSTVYESRAWVKAFEVAGVVLMQSTSEYPCPAEHTGLNVLEQMRTWCHYEASYPVSVGLSDHSGTIYPGIAATALGCQVLEVHVCWSKDQRGLDTAASITVQQLHQLVRGVRFVEAAMKPLDKDAMAERLDETRRVFMAPQEDIQAAVDSVFKRTPQEKAMASLLKEITKS